MRLAELELELSQESVTRKGYITVLFCADSAQALPTFNTRRFGTRCLPAWSQSIPFRRSYNLQRRQNHHEYVTIIAKAIGVEPGEAELIVSDNLYTSGRTYEPAIASGCGVGSGPRSR